MKFIADLILNIESQKTDENCK